VTSAFSKEPFGAVGVDGGKLPKAGFAALSASSVARENVAHGQPYVELLAERMAVETARSFGFQPPDPTDSFPLCFYDDTTESLGCWPPR